jgi:hypothetical protein
MRNRAESASVSAATTVSRPAAVSTATTGRLCIFQVMVV